VIDSGEKASSRRVPLAAWFDPATGTIVNDAIARLARHSVVLLGETHDNAEHHRWQLQTLAALHGLRPGIVVAFEMFPRRVQPVLDRWVAGELGEAAFLEAVEWGRVWNVDAQLYLPLFHFARMNRLPMIAMNVDRELIRTVDAKGFDAVAPEQRQDVTRPASPTAGYIDFLMSAYRAHDHAVKEADANDPAFRRFVESQQVWDRAMAQSIAGAAKADSAPLVVGILGAGHIVNGFGVPHQLNDLGVRDVSWLVPWEDTEDCTRLTPGYVDAAFGVAHARADDTAQRRPRLGVVLETSGEAVRIKQVQKGSVAEAAGIKEGDVITEAAGVAVRDMAAVRAIVQKQADGTWLPLKIARDGAVLEVVAKFPPAQQ
jgi:uncharacterized iron-regulated protein